MADDESGGAGGEEEVAAGGHGIILIRPECLTNALKSGRTVSRTDIRALPIAEFEQPAVIVQLRHTDNQRRLLRMTTKTAFRFIAFCTSERE